MNLTSLRAIDPARRHEHPHLSISAAETYTQCARSYQLQYHQRLGKGQASTDQMDIGDVFHKVLADCNSAKIRTGEYPDANALQTLVKHYMEKCIGFTPATLVREAAKVYGLVRIYFSGSFARDLTPCMIESRFLLEGPSSPPFRLYGLFDVTSHDAMYDYKTSWNERADTKPSNQINLYAAAYFRITGSWPREIGFVNLVRGTNEVKIKTWQVNQNDVQKTLDNLWYIHAKILAGEFPPQVGTHCDRCSFSAEHCVEGKDYLTRMKTKRLY
jgi:hypothetical protein